MHKAPANEWPPCSGLHRGYNELTVVFMQFVHLNVDRYGPWVLQGNCKYISS